jgi:Amt family ammonium transporter
LTDDPVKVRLQIEVQDTGPGIPADQFDHIFETFVRYDQEDSSSKGAGLGLSISKALVEKMGGRISLESELSVGSRFTLDLPMIAVQAEDILVTEMPAPEIIGLQDDGTEWRILVVDDNDENRLLLSNLLRQIGFSVQEAENGQEALALFQQWHPQLIWMDMRMPVMDGYQATKKIRNLPGGDAVVIAAITASVLEEQRAEILAAGCDDLVRKPFRDSEIFEVMADHLGVEFVTQEGPAPAIQLKEINLTAEMLAELPPELLQELREITLTLNRDAALAVVERIADQAPETGAGLRELVDNFQMSRIHKLLAETE